MRYHKEHNTNPFDKSEVLIPIGIFNKISELSKTSLKVYKYIRTRAFKEDGILYFDIKDAKDYCGFKENKSIYNAMSELINSDILAGRKDANEYYFNPKYIKNEKETL
jgi:hypothetical protein